MAAILTYYAINGGFVTEPFATGGPEMEMLSATSTEVVLRNPTNGFIVTLTGTGLVPITVGGVPSLAGTLTGFLSNVEAGGAVHSTITGISWNATAFAAAIRDLLVNDDFTGFDALLSLQSFTLDNRPAATGVDFGFSGVTSAITMLGSDFEDTLGGGAGNDTIDPGASDSGEVIIGSRGSDTFDLRGVGPETYAVLDYGYLDAVQVTLDGVADSGRVVKTGAGTDTILGVRRTMEAYSFDVYGTMGNDTFTLRPVETSGSYLYAAGGGGNDTFNLTLNSWIRLGYNAWVGDKEPTTGIVANLATGVVSVDGFGGQDRINILGGTVALELSGSWFDDSVTGSTRAEVLFLNDGNDTATGGNGNDSLYGGNGSDSLSGGDGDDYLRPGTNDDRDVLDAGRGENTIDFAPNEDPAEGDRNRHTVSHRLLGDQAAIAVTVNGFSGTGGVTSSLGGTLFENLSDALNGGGLRIEATGLADTFDIALAGSALIEIVAGRGSDSIALQGRGDVQLRYDIDSNGVAATQGAVVNLETGAVANDGFGFAETIDIPDDPFYTGDVPYLYLWLTAQADRITGRAELDDWFIVLGGNDTLRGEGTGEGTFGPRGTDTLDYGADGATGGVRVDLGAGTARGVWGGQAFTQSVTGFEDLWGTADFGDRLFGSRGANQIAGLGGDDTIMGDGFRAAYAPTQAAQVYRLYQATLDRAPDSGGLNDWTVRLAEGTQTLAQVAAGFVGSAEFQRTYGALDDSAFVTLLYRNVLDRAPDAGGLAGWVAQLQGGTSRAQVVTGISESREFVQKTQGAATAFVQARNEATWIDDVYRLYEATLNRLPDVSGLVDWVDRLAGGTSFLTAVSGFVGSREFQNTYGPLTDTAFVTLLYQNVLGRAPDAGGLANWLGQLSGGATRAEVVAGFAQSREFVLSTTDGMASFVQSISFFELGNPGVTADRIYGDEGANRLWGGAYADDFQFYANQAANDRVMDFERWDILTFIDFGYDDTGDIRAHLAQVGADVVFQDQGVTVTLVNTQLAAITDDSLVFGGVFVG